MANNYIIEVMEIGYKPLPVEKLNSKFLYSSYQRNLKYSETRFRRFFRRITLNGWLIKSKHFVIVPASNPLKYSFYRSKRVLNYDAINRKGFVSYKSYIELLKIVFKYLRIFFMLKRKFNLARLDYKRSVNELSNINFWMDYLEIKDN